MGQVPTLLIDGLTLTQSVSLLSSPECFPTDIVNVSISTSKLQNDQVEDECLF